MKKTLIALAALATSAAFAQSSVNLTGVVGFGYQQNPAAATNDKGFTNTDATIAVAVKEDLGGGMSANAAIAFDGASANFGQALNRRNTSINLTGGFGSVTLSNTRSSDLLTRGMVAPSSLPQGMYDSGVISRSPIDLLTYGIAFGGVSPYIAYAESNTDGGTTPAFKTVILGANYAGGPLAAGVAFKSTTGTLPAGVEKTNLELFGTYNLGVATVGLGFDSKTTTTGKAAFSFGVAAPLGPVTAGLNFAKRNTVKVTEVVAKYDLSKRTNVNASFGKQTNDQNAIVNGNQYRIGVNHSF